MKLANRSPTEKQKQRSDFCKMNSGLPGTFARFRKPHAQLIL